LKIVGGFGATDAAVTGWIRLYGRSRASQIAMSVVLIFEMRHCAEFPSEMPLFGIQTFAEQIYAKLTLQAQMGCCQAASLGLISRELLSPAI